MATLNFENNKIKSQNCYKRTRQIRIHTHKAKKMKTTEFSSSSSPSDRRVGALLRHLTAGTDSPSTDRLSSVIASPTSEVSSGSVFAHLVQAPEDPILGVHSSSSSSMYPCVVVFKHIRRRVWIYMSYTFDFLVVIPLDRLLISVVIQDLVMDDDRFNERSFDVTDHQMLNK